MPTKRIFVGLILALFVAGAPGAQANVSVLATVETDPETHPADAADDSAIWIHPTDPSLSTVIGTDKTSPLGGLDVFDLAGRRLYFYPDARMNNVDVRYNFPLGSSRVSLVGVTNRSAQTLDFYKVNVPDRSLSTIGSVPVRSDMGTARGFALYHSPTSGKYYAFVTDSGKTDQFELSGASGSVTGTFVRRLAFLGVTEGLVADDELKRIYVAEEDIGGVWRFGAEPADPTTGTKVLATTETGGPIAQDIKGITIYYGRNSTGYLIAVSQGADDFHVLSRVTNAHLGAFQIDAGNGIDQVTNIDGIDVTNFNLGSAFPQGFFISHDDVNDGANQNHKLVPWQSIANGFSPPLLIDPFFDPRQIGAPPPAVPYPRPNGAAKVRVTLTPAFKRCDSPDSGHGAPIDAGSCRSAAESSQHLTVPNDDSTLANGSLTVRVLCTNGETPPCPAAGEQEDLSLRATATDVLTKPGLLDYGGELEARLTLRITDRYNGAGLTEQATVRDTTLSFAVPCTPTGDPLVGAACTVNTTARAVMPGIVKEGKRAIWELGRVEVRDGGPDGLASSQSGNTPFLSQAIFVP